MCALVLQRSCTHPSTTCSGLADVLADGGIAGRDTSWASDDLEEEEEEEHGELMPFEAQREHNTPLALLLELQNVLSLRLC